MTLAEIKAVGKHYEPFAIPAEEFKENHLGGSFNMSKLPFEKDLKEACAKPTLTQRETALIALVGKLQDALVDSNWDKLLAEQQYEEAIEVIKGLDEDLAKDILEIESLECDIRHLEEQIYDLENELESIVESLED